MKDERSQPLPSTLGIHYTWHTRKAINSFAPECHRFFNEYILVF